MRILIALNHPAHYHMLKFIAQKLGANHSIKIVIKDKDILEELLRKDNVNYLKINQKGKRRNIFSIILGSTFELLKQDINLYKIIKDWKPDVMVGTDISISHIGWIKGIPSIVLNEDDYAINKLFCAFTYPFATHIISPAVCSVGSYFKKKISYDGFQKLAYLHPNHFIPDKKIVEQYIKSEKYFIIRLVELTAAHDIEHKHSGLDEKFVVKIVKILQEKGDVYITSESELPNILEQYRLQINPTHIHHILYYASLFIGDSQSMSVESSMLGTPSVRFSTFSGRISVLEELEHKYHLTFGIQPNEPEKLLDLINKLVLMPNLKVDFQERRKKMLADKIDMTAFMIWFIENYPQSVKTMRDKPEETQARFR